MKKIGTNYLNKLELDKIVAKANSNNFNSITAIAAQICNTKAAYIHLTNNNNQWLISNYGLSKKEISNDYSFFTNAIISSEKTTIENISNNKLLLKTR